MSYQLLATKNAWGEDRESRVKDFKELKVWGKAQHLAVEVYRVTRCFPREERYGLTSQLRRSAVSLGATSPKVAEGEPMVISLAS
jgi:hypothetical protein